MICFVQKCKWLCCNIGCNILKQTMQNSNMQVYMLEMNTLKQISAIFLLKTKRSAIVET